MEKVSSAMHAIIGSYKRTVLINIMLKKSWGSIVGEQLEAVSSFIEAKFVGENRVNVICEILSASSIIMKPQKQKIMETIIQMTGINEINIICKHRCALDRYSPSPGDTNYVLSSIGKQNFSK
jgi:hypothetical protein